MRVPFEWYALHGVWSARCACTRTETYSSFACVYFFAEFLISLPHSSNRLGPTDKCDGEAHKENSAGALQRGASLHLLPLVSSFVVLRRHATIFDDVMNAHKSHTVIHWARVALW